MTDEELKAAVDDMIEHEPDDNLRARLRDLTSRGGFSSIAANIAADRYSAGSTAARAGIYILATRGFKAFSDFVDELERYERC